MVIRLATLALVLVSASLLPTLWRRPGPAHGLLLAAWALLPWSVPLLLGLLGAWPPLRHAYARRKERAAKAALLPDLVLALRLAAEDGHGALEALQRLPASSFDVLGPALEEFQSELRTTFDVRLSLKRLKEHLDFPSGERLVDALLSGETLGVPLRLTLANQDSMLRSSRVDQVRQRAGYFPYALTVMTGLLFINAAIIFGYPRFLALFGTFSSISGKGF